MKRLVMILLALVAIGGATEINAQSWLEQLGQRAKERAKENIERKVEQKTDDLIDGIFNKAEDATKGKGRKKRGAGEDTPAETQPAAVQQATTPERDGVINNASVAQSGQQKGQSLETTYAKSDFVPGDEIFFEDNLVNEQMGEFPSQWDLLNGNAEVASMAGVQAINLEAGGSSTIAPLMKEKHYLPDVFTLEFDYWVNSYTETNQAPSQNYRLQFYDASGEEVMHLTFAEGYVDWEYISTSGDRRTGRVGEYKEVIDAWSHLSVSFNKRAFKAYINGSRVTNIPNMAAPAYFTIRNTSWNDHRTLVTNFRLAKGAVPLYDRMMSEGKFITYGITFDVGKATIKPESMGEINRIVQLMTENPDLKFSVEGHTDSTGNAASNQTLSEQRSQAIVAKLVELGIAQDRLTAVGKGQNSPIADNNTDEGRAKNRRVEFVKI